MFILFLSLISIFPTKCSFCKSKLDGFRGVHKPQLLPLYFPCTFSFAKLWGCRSTSGAASESTAKAGEWLLVQMVPGFAFVSRSFPLCKNTHFKGRIQCLGTHLVLFRKRSRRPLLYIFEIEQTILYMAAQVHLNRKLAAKQIK